ncbi:MAG: spore maturation protein, partial [Desulfatitalea sp.]|nr:spore maturation protein [Desulfatitalea sp.]
MNVIFLVLVGTAFTFAAWHQWVWVPVVGQPSPMEALSAAMITAAGGAVELAIGLVGVMTLFLGLIKVAEAGGMLQILARLIRPLMVRLFPEVPADHPAMGAMILNMAANALGLGNAATPFGIRAMQELDKLNPHPGTATNAMALFLAINTSSITLLPTGVIAIRAAAGSVNPAGILPTTLTATIGSTIVALIAAKLYSRLVPSPAGTAPPAPRRQPDSTVAPGTDTPVEETAGYPLWVSVAALFALFSMIPLTVVYGHAVSP